MGEGLSEYLFIPGIIIGLPLKVERYLSDFSTNQIWHIVKHIRIETCCCRRESSRVCLVSGDIWSRLLNIGAGEAQHWHWQTPRASVTVLLGGAGFIAWCLRCLFLETYLKKALCCTRLVGGMYDKYRQAGLSQKILDLLGVPYFRGVSGAKR